MSAPRLPALRLTAEGECVIQDGVTLDLPPSNKFSVSYAPSEGRQNSSAGSSSAPSPKESSGGLSSSESEEDNSDGDDGEQGMPQYAQVNEESNLVASPPTSPQTSYHMDSIPEKRGPHMSRTLSMPLPSQLSQLQNPHRPSPLNSFHSSSQVQTSPSTQRSSQVTEASVELADSIQLMIQTMLQISPPQVLDPVKEHFSACALSVPTSSMAALFTAMKNINYISANMSSFCGITMDTVPEGSKQTDSQQNPHNEFDIGEMLQSVGDVLSGSAAQAGVDLVIYHGDVGLKHVYVSGDESGISFALSHIVRQVLSTAERGDSIELGLLVGLLSSSHQGRHLESPPVDDLLSAAPLESNGPIRVTVRISHKYSPTDHPGDVAATELRPKPSFSALLLRRILRQIGGTLIADLPPPVAFPSGRTCDLDMVLDRVPVPILTPPELRGEEENSEPSLEQLASFGETLKGRRVSLYANAKGSFAHHLTSYLTAWGMDVTHVSPDGQVDGTTEQPSIPSIQTETRLSSYNPLLATYPENGTLATAIPKAERRPNVPEPPSLIFIDDDVEVLKERLQALRFEHQPQLSLHSRKRPSLSSNHRPRSSSQIARLLNVNNISRQPPPPVVIMHFISLANYKLVKDVMQSVMASYATTATPLPEVMIIPKPAGPRRFLTALHTAIMKPTVDPFFTPIATSPISPGLHQTGGSFFSSPISEHGSQASNGGSYGSTSGSQTQSPTIKSTNRPHGSRSNSDRSTKSNDGNKIASAMPPSPLAFPDNVEYFSAAAEKLGTSPSSGLVIQSPDGQTAGIYFHPRSKTGSRNLVSQSMERDKGQLSIPNSRRGSTARVPSGGRSDSPVTFSSLHHAQMIGNGEARPGLSQNSSTSSAGRGRGGSTSAASNPDGPSTTQLAGKLPTGITADPNQQTSPSATGKVTPFSRKSSDDTRKPSAPSSPTEGTGTSTPSRRGLAKRPTTDNKDPSSSSSTAKKNKIFSPSDANVVPPISVLIVDDNPINQTILSTFMRRKRIKYDLASNGQEAVQKWRSGGFHLILMDIQMPVMDGIQATKEIRRLEKSNATAGYPPLTPSTEEGHTPSDSANSSGTSESRSLNSPYRSSVIIVALTASSLQSDRVAALAAGCNDFLTKPVSLLWLNNKIIEWGSIKALQMWADIRPDAVRSLASGQAQQARNVAERLHVPKGRITPSPTRRTTSALEDNAAAIALASSAGAVPNIPSPGGMTIPDRPLSAASSSQAGPPDGPPSLDNRKPLDNVRKESLDDASTPTANDPPRRRTRSTTPVPTRTQVPIPEPKSTALDGTVKIQENGFTDHEKEPETNLLSTQAIPLNVAPGPSP